MSGPSSVSSSQQSSRSSSPAPQVEKKSTSPLAQTHSAAPSSPRLRSFSSIPTLRAASAQQHIDLEEPVVVYIPPPPPLKEDASTTAAPASVALPPITKQEMDDALKAGLLAVAALANRPGFAEVFTQNPQLAKVFLKSLLSAKADELGNIRIVFSALSQVPGNRVVSSLVNECCSGILRSLAFTDTFRQGAVLLKSQDAINQAQEERGLCLSALIKCGFSVDVRDRDQVAIFVSLLIGIELRSTLIQMQQAKAAAVVASLTVEEAKVDAAAAQSAKHYILVKQELALCIGKKLPNDQKVVEIKAKLYKLCENNDCSQAINRAIDELTQKSGQPVVSGQKLFSPADAAKLKGMLR